MSKKVIVYVVMSLIVMSSIIPLPVMGQEARQIPFTVYGYVYNDDTHEIIPNAIVYVENKRSGDILTTVSNSYGQYSIDVLNFKTSVIDGDVLKIVGKYNNLSAYTEVTIIKDSPGKQVDLYLTEQDTTSGDTGMSLTTDSIIGLIQWQNTILIALIGFVVVLLTVMVFNNIRASGDRPKL